MSTIKKANEFMIADWEEIADEMIKRLFLKDDEAVVSDRLSIEKDSAVEVYEIKGYIHTLKLN
jgi:hypothetical protein